MMTAAFGETHNVAGRMDLTRVKVLAWLCDIALPFFHYHERFTGTNIDISLQVENVYHIDVNKLHIHIDHRISAKCCIDMYPQVILIHYIQLIYLQWISKGHFLI